MKKILEAILATSPSSCVYKPLFNHYQQAFYIVMDLHHYLFVLETFIGAIVAFMDNAHVQVTFLVEKLSRILATTVALVTHS